MELVMRLAPDPPHPRLRQTRLLNRACEFCFSHPLEAVYFLYQISKQSQKEHLEPKYNENGSDDERL